MAEKNTPNLMPHRPNNEASLPRLLVFDLEGTLPNGSGVSAQKRAMQAILARAQCNPMDYTALATGATHDLARAVLADGGYLSYFNVLRAVDGLNTLDLHVHIQGAEVGEAEQCAVEAAGEMGFENGVVRLVESVAQCGRLQDDRRCRLHWHYSGSRQE